MYIDREKKLDFSDVLIRPKRSTLRSRKEVDLNREFKFRKDFQGWINPNNRMWEDEVERKEIRSI